jgi:hypothetical protein
MLRAYMHGFFVDNRLWAKAKSLADPLAYDSYRAAQVGRRRRTGCTAVLLLLLLLLLLLASPAPGSRARAHGPARPSSGLERCRLAAWRTAWPLSRPQPPPPPPPLTHRSRRSWRRSAPAASLCSRNCPRRAHQPALCGAAPPASAPLCPRPLCCGALPSSPAATPTAHPHPRPARQVNARAAAQLLAQAEPDAKRRRKGDITVNPMDDARFAAMFEDEAFTIDERSSEYRMLHPNLVAQGADKDKDRALLSGWRRAALGRAAGGWWHLLVAVV